MKPQAISFVAKSGTGKTTLVEQVIADLSSRGWQVGALKHGAHRFNIDHPGKDSYRFTDAGAATTLITSPDKLALVKKHQAEPPMAELLEHYFADMDIVLVEGFKASGLPKIEVYREGHSRELLSRTVLGDGELLAVATDASLDLDVPLLDLNRPSDVADFVEAWLQHREQAA